MRTWKARVTVGLAVAALVGGVLAPPAAATTKRWARSVGKGLQAVAVDARGNSYSAGQTDVGNTRGAFLVKFAPDGRKLWTRTWRPSGSQGSYGTAVAIGPDGNIVWGGAVYGSCEGGGWFLQRVTPKGRVLWTRSQNGWRKCAVATTLTDIAIGEATIVTSMYDHGCCGDSYADAFVKAFGLGGAASWTRDIEPQGVWKGFYETATSITIGGFDNVYLAGWAATKLRPGEFVLPGFVFVQKLSSGGGVLWQRRVEGSWWRGTEAAVAARGDAVLVTSRMGRKGDAFVARFSVGGDRMWTRTWGPDPRFGSTPYGISIDGDGTAWVVGQRLDPVDDNPNAFLRTFSPGGAPTSALVIDARGWLGAFGVDASGRDSAVAVGWNSRIAQDHGRIWSFRE
jgi:hypothetical protein